MSKCQFFDPAGVLYPSDGNVYVWHVNHLSQDGPNLTRNLSSDSRAQNGAGVISVEGDDAPIILSLSGTILHKLQYEAFLAFWGIRNTFKFTNEEGSQYEVSMASLSLQKERKHWNYADASMRYHVWRWKMDLRVHTILYGDL